MHGECRLVRNEPYRVALGVYLADSGLYLRNLICALFYLIKKQCKFPVDVESPEFYVDELVSLVDWPEIYLLYLLRLMRGNCGIVYSLCSLLPVDGRLRN